MKSKLLSWGKSCLMGTAFLLGMPAAFAVPMDSTEPFTATENPYSSDASAAYTNVRQAFMSTTLLGIKVFAQRAMNAAIQLQSEAMARGDETLAGFAQGVYNNTKRAGMSESVEQAREYIESAMSYAHKAQVLLGQALEDRRHHAARFNLNQDGRDPGVEIYGGRRDRNPRQQPR
jgi:hypothetical protein